MKIFLNSLDHNIDGFSVYTPDRYAQRLTYFLNINYLLLVKTNSMIHAAVAPNVISSDHRYTPHFFDLDLSSEASKNNLDDHVLLFDPRYKAPCLCPRPLPFCISLILVRFSFDLKWLSALITCFVSVSGIKRLSLAFDLFSFTFSQPGGILHQDQEAQHSQHHLHLGHETLQPPFTSNQLLSSHTQRALCSDINSATSKGIGLETHPVSSHAHMSSPTDERFCQPKSILTLAIYPL